MGVQPKGSAVESKKRRNLSLIVRSLCALGLLFSLTLSPLAFSSHAYAYKKKSSSFSKAEKRRLDRGALVARPRKEKRGKYELIGGTSYLTVDCSPDEVWRSMRDVKRYPYMLPELVSAKKVSNKRGDSVVRLHNKHGVFDIKYYLRMHFDANQRSVVFKLDGSRNNDLDAAWGFMRVRPWKKGRSLISYGVMTDPGLGMLSAPIESHLRKWLLRVPMTIRKFVERKKKKSAKKK